MIYPQGEVAPGRGARPVFPVTVLQLLAIGLTILRRCVLPRGERTLRPVRPPDLG